MLKASRPYLRAVSLAGFAMEGWERGSKDSNYSRSHPAGKELLIGAGRPVLKNTRRFDEDPDLPS
jgi:hypothetical protein